MNALLDGACRVAHRAAGRVRRRLSGSDDGFVLLESIIAISLITFIMAAIGVEFVSGTAAVARQRATQSAAQVADSTLEQIRALKPSDLVTGRGSLSVQQQLAKGNAIAKVSPWLQMMDQASDPNAAPADGTSATIPTCDPAPQGAAGPALCTQKPGVVAFTVAQFLGTCWLVTSGTSSNCVPATQKTSGSVQYLRAVVSVSWTGGTCGTGCYYVTSTLINASADPTFKANQPPPASPAITAPGDQVNDVGDSVALTLSLQTGTGIPGYKWDLTAGTLPSGLSLSASGTISGTVSGPTSSSPVTVRVTDGFGRQDTATFTWTVVNAPQVSAPPNQLTQINTAVSLQLTSSCANAPCVFTLNNAPQGLSVNSAGLITGTPTVAGTKTTSVTITDKSNNPVTSSAFTWTVLPAATTCPTAVSLLNGGFEAPTVPAGPGKNVNNGTANLAWRTNDANSLIEFWTNSANSTSQNSNTPIAAQDGTQWVEVNGGGMDTLSQDLTTTPGQVLQWSIWHRARNVNNNPNGQDSIQVQMGSTSQQTAQVPAGATSATISDGTAAWVQYTGVYTVPAGQTTTRFQVAAISTSSGIAGAGNFLDAVSVTGIPCLSASPATQTSTVNTAITPFQLSAYQGSGSYTWSLGGALPTGLSLSSSGLITGTPTTLGSSSVALILTDSLSGYQQAVTFTWTVLAGPAVSAPANQTTSVGASVSVTVGSTCANSPCTYILNNTPAGLTMNPATGTITGSPTATGTTSSTVTIRDAAGSTATSNPFTWTVKAAPTITSPGNQNITVGTAVSVTSMATCPNGPCSYSVDTLPVGLTLATGTGAITGTPNTTGATNSVVTVRDSAGATARTSFTWTIYDAPTITAPSAQTTSIGATVSLTVGSTCANGPCTYSATVLPAGLSMSGATITGTPTTTGTTNSTVTIRDASGVTAAATFSWLVKAAPTVTAPANQTTSVGAAVSVTVASSCANSPCTYILNNTPAGLTINPATGTITGSPTATGTTSSTVTIRDAAGSTATSNPFTWTVKAAPTITSPGNQTTTVGATVSVAVGSTCANGPCTYSATNLPGGLGINSGTGTVTGNPTTAGSSSVTITSRDAAGSTSTATFTWTVYTAPTVTSPGNQTVTVGATVSVAVGSTCANGPCTYTLNNPPPGLSMTGATITGTPTTAGTTTSTVTIRDNSSVTAISASFTWTVAAAPTVTAPANQTTTVGATVSVAVGSTCANGPCTYTLNNPPAGLSMTGATITGTPTTAGTTTSTVTIRDNSNIVATSGSFTWTVKAAPSITSPGNRTTTAGVAVSLQLTSSCANTPCTYSLDNAPTGLTISAGVISGTPNTPGTSSAVTASVTDAAGVTATTAAFSWTIYARPTITSPGNQASTVNTGLILPISSSCANSPCSYVLSGTPNTVTINSATGVISGTPTATGTSTAKVTMTDAGGVAVNTGNFTWTFYARPTITAPANQSTVNNAAVNLTLTKSCPDAPCAYALNGGPAGLSITGAGIVTGTVTSAPQVFTGVSATVTDSAGATATTAAFTWTVTAPLVGHWAFDEASGATAADSSGANHSATLTGGYSKTATAAQGANAVTMNGTTGVATASGTVLDTSGNFTVGAWVRLSSTSSTQTFASQDGTNISAFALQYNATLNRFVFSRPASDSTSATVTTASATSAPTVGQWYYLTGVHSATADTLTLYVNGVRQGTPVAYSTGWNAAGTGKFVIGRGRSGGAANYTSASIDDVRAYSSSLSDDAAAQLAQAGYWSFDDGSGTTANDSSQNNFDGTVSGGATWTTPIVGASALQFDGSSGAVTASPNVLDTSQSFTVSAWAKADTTTSTGAVVSADGSNISSFLLRQAGTKWAMVSVASDATNAAVTNVYSSSNLVVGQWYHLVGVYNSVAKTVALYVNGVLQGTPVSVTGSFKAGSLVIGRSLYQTTTNYFDGAIDDVHAFRFPVDQAGVAALATLTPPAPGAPTATAGASSATVSWTAPADVAGDPVTGYVLTPYLDGVAQTPVTYTSTATSQIVTGLTTGGSYTFRVAAVNANGTSAPSPASGSVLVS